MKTLSSCPVCGAMVAQPFLKLHSIPVNCSALWSTPDEAYQAPRGDIYLGVCESCGMVFNLAFDPLLLAYDTTYENSLHFSPVFQEFARDLANRLVDKYGIRQKHVIEIGCGQGDFLAMLCKAGSNQGIGFDPSYSGTRDKQNGARITFVQDIYSEAYVDRPVDLICCRHVLEHLTQPRQLLVGLRRMLNNHPAAVVYFEVPNAESVLGGATLLDVIYAHCSYFAPPALNRLFRDAGFRILQSKPCFGEQFLYIEAEPNGSLIHQYENDAAGIEKALALASSFERHFKGTVLHWSAFINNAIAEGRRLALWGSGSKGTMFLNVVPSGKDIDIVVDSNPRKQGSHVPGTGQRIVSPEQLRELRPDVILIANPLYEPEIRNMVRDLGLTAELVPVLPVRAPSAASQSKSC